VTHTLEVRHALKQPDEPGILGTMHADPAEQNNPSNINQIFIKAHLPV